MPQSLARLIAPFLASPAAASLATRYAESQRYYHDVSHVREVLAHVAEVAEQLVQLRPVTYAALYHDAVYDPRRKDNEARSAELALEEIVAFAEPAEQRVVHELILATGSHGSSTAHTGDTALFLDCDAAILGADADRYRAYSEGVRKEYGHVSNLLYRIGRGKFVRSMLKRPAIFNTHWFEARYGTQARLNLRAELASL